jgi:monovalent cation:H+ antiporter-2, CPA2 family
VGEPDTVAALADIGIIFLLFAIGLQLSLRDLLRVGRVAVVGGSAQVIALIAVGYASPWLLGFSPLEALFFGAFVELVEHGAGQGPRRARRAGHRARPRVIRLVDGAGPETIVLVVVLSALAGRRRAGQRPAAGVGEAVLFLAIVLPVGLLVLPWFFERVALLRSREVFVLAWWPSRWARPGSPSSSACRWRWAPSWPAC